MKRDQLLAVPRAGFEPAGTRQAAGFYVTIPTCGALDTSEKARKATETPACKPNQLPNQSVLGWDIVATPDLPPWLTWEPTNALAYLTVISTLCRMSDRRSGVDVRRRTRGPWVYFITIDGVASVKIGTAQHLSSRLLALQACAPARLRLLAVTPGSRSEEWFLHTALASSRMHGEWFAPSDDLGRIVHDLRALRGDS